MRIHPYYLAIGAAFGGLVACTQPGGERVRPEPQAAEAGPACPAGDAACAAREPARSSVPLKPAVPPVPDSPIKVDCAKLPTQVERDTCTNRKASTG